jgi:hypothetical protein
MSNQVDYFEVASSDPDASRAFYGGLFDWNIGEASMPARYSPVNTDAGGLWDTTEMGSGNWAIFYVHVDDVNDAVAQAVELGATVAIPFVDNSTIQFAHLVDPQGNRFGVWKRKDE